MTDLHHGSPKHKGHGTENGGFEREDMGAGPVIGFIVTVVVTGVLVYYGIWGMFNVLDKMEAKNQKTASPLVRTEKETRETDHNVISEKIQQTFPEPRLEDNERTEINDVRYNEEVRLNSSGWVDQSAGVAHIPIERAMQLIAERGLPTNPQAGTAPPSIVESGRAAASAADTSNAAKKKGK